MGVGFLLFRFCWVLDRGGLFCSLVVLVSLIDLAVFDLMILVYGLRLMISELD